MKEAHLIHTLTDLRQIKCFLLDMDGTFYLGDRLLEGSLDFLNALQRTGKKALFLTNNSSKSADAYLQKLRRMGVCAPFLNVYTSGQAAGEHLIKNHPGGRVFLLGNEQLQKELEAIGVTVDQSAPDIVLVGFDTSLDYDKMARACDFVRAGLPMIATHPDFNCPTETGFIPDIGAILAFIEASTGRKPGLILGKPYAGIIEGALEKTGCAASETAMVGDRLYTDIAAGVNHNMTAILVLTGEATRRDAEASPIKPHLIVERLSDMIPYLECGG
jgi:HAD superfamily hydrolase (TIGR01457 family)